MSGWCCGAGGWAIFVWILLLAALVIEAVLLIRVLWERGAGSGEPGSPAAGNALRILEERARRDRPARVRRPTANTPSIGP